MNDNKGRELDRKELHMDFGQSCDLGRRYNVWSGERYDSPYIYENDQEMKERFNRFYKEENNIYSTVDLTIEKWLKGENINDYEGDRG